MKIMMPVEVVSDRCPYCKDFDADVMTRTFSGMNVYDQDSEKAENGITVINEIRCSHFQECAWRVEHILAGADPKDAREEDDEPEKKSTRKRALRIGKKEVERK